MTPLYVPYLPLLFPSWYETVLERVLPAEVITPLYPAEVRHIWAAGIFGTRRTGSEHNKGPRRRWRDWIIFYMRKGWELGMFSQEKRRLGGILALCISIGKIGVKKIRGKLSSVCSVAGWAQVDLQKILSQQPPEKEKKTTHFHNVGVIKYCHSLPGKTVESPPWRYSKHSWTVCLEKLALGNCSEQGDLNHLISKWAHLSYDSVSSEFVHSYFHFLHSFLSSFLIFHLQLMIQGRAVSFCRGNEKMPQLILTATNIISFFFSIYLV